jgi:hypothetical protein
MNTYKLVKKSANQLEQLEKEVNELVENGWKVVGKLQQSRCDGAAIFIQQMKYKDEQPKRLPSPFYVGGYIPKSEGECKCKTPPTTK